MIRCDRCGILEVSRYIKEDKWGGQICSSCWLVEDALEAGEYDD